MIVHGEGAPGGGGPPTDAGAAFTIEAARPSDIPAAAALVARLFEIEADFIPDPVVQARALSLLVALPPDRARVAIARAGDAVVGTASAQLVVSTGEGALSAWIEDVFVEAGWRGRGVGRRLLADLLAWARAQGATRAQLLIDLDNAPAEAFYARLGWASTRLGVRRLMLTVPAAEGGRRE
jgi:GNAT superfamily N-acetyltransferase